MKIVLVEPRADNILQYKMSTLVGWTFYNSLIIKDIKNVEPKNTEYPGANFPFDRLLAELKKP